MENSRQVLYSKLCKENNISNGINKIIIVFALLILSIFIGVFLIGNNISSMKENMEYIEILEGGETIDVTKFNTGIAINTNVIFIVILIVSFIAIILLAINNKKTKQERIYRENVIAPVLNENTNGFKYVPYNGFTKEQYNGMGFVIADTYKVKEYIKIPFNSNCIEITNVEIGVKDKDGYSTVFDGYVSEFIIPKVIEKEINIVYNALNLIKYDNTVNIDNSRFNEKYSLLCEDEYLAMTLFTSDVLLKLMELYNKYRIIVNVNIIGNKVYMQSRKEVGLNDNISYKYKDIERKIKDVEFITQMADAIYKMIIDYQN